MPRPIDCGRQYSILRRTGIKYRRRMNYRINFSQVLIIGKHSPVKYVSHDKANAGHARELRASTKERNGIARNDDPLRINLPPMPQPVVEHRLAKKTRTSRYKDSLQFNSSIMSDRSANNLTAVVRDVTAAAISSV